MHNCEPVYWSFSIPLKINKSENSIIMFTGMENVYQSVLVSTDLFHKLYIQGLSEASELHRVKGNQWCIVGPLGQEHIVSPFLNEKWTVGEIKLRGVEWGTVKPLTWILHFTSAQLSLEPSSQWAQVPPLWGKKGQVEVFLQIRHTASETIINKAVNGRSAAAKTANRATSLNSEPVEVNRASQPVGFKCGSAPILTHDHQGPNAGIIHLSTSNKSSGFNTKWHRQRLNLAFFPQNKLLYN